MQKLPLTSSPATPLPPVKQQYGMYHIECFLPAHNFFLITGLSFIIFLIPFKMERIKLEIF